METEQEEIPIVCTLSDEEFRRREREVIARLMPRVEQVDEVEEGYDLIFPRDDDTLREIAEFIVLERQCCPFLDFDLSVKRGTGAVRLGLSGPAGAKEFISSTFILK